jgi:N-acetylmuramoyl-L-alanine amidase
VFGEERERTTAGRLLRAVASEYPSSRYARGVPDALGQLADIAANSAQSRASPPPEAASGLATIKDIRRAVLPDAVRVIIELDAEVLFHDERLENPARVFVDLSSTRAVPGLLDRTVRFESDADVVRQVRIGRHPNNTIRVVLDVDGISSYSVYPLYSPYRLVIDCIRAQPQASTTAPASTPADTSASPPVAVSEAGAPVESHPAGTPAAASPPLDPDAATPLPATDPTPATPPVVVRPPASNLGGGFSIARQLGLGVSRIVIDPGHGGHDPGALGHGTSEAELVLDVALRLERLLAKTPGIEVVLTRRTDTFVPLQERTMMANREGADLFLSIHANASANLQARGVETYVLNFATNRRAEVVAARENAASARAMGALPDLVKAIALNNKLDESRDFAAHVQRALIAGLKGPNRNIRDLGVKQAPFVVLIGAEMPSVLAEISFLTNAQEVRLLRGSAYRQRIAKALFDAIRSYQNSLKAQSKVAQQ